MDSSPPHPRSPWKLEEKDESWNPKFGDFGIGKVNLGVFLSFALIKGLYEF